MDQCRAMLSTAVYHAAIQDAVATKGYHDLVQPIPDTM